MTYAKLWLLLFFSQTNIAFVSSTKPYQKQLFLAKKNLSLYMYKIICGSSSWALQSLPERLCLVNRSVKVFSTLGLPHMLLVDVLSSVQT